jgi:hypothetical protein
MRLKLYLLLPVLVLASSLLSACTSGPKEQAREWADRFPDEIGQWELDDDRTELSVENQSNYGYVTIAYSGDNDINDFTAYITINVFATESAARVSLEQQVLDWQVMGVEFDRLRIRGYVSERVDSAVLPGGQIAFYQLDEVLVTLRVVADESGLEMPEDDIEQLLITIFEIAANIE